jgi:hypothetical protein
MDIGAASEQHHSSISLNEQSFATYSGSRLPMRGFVVLMFMFTLSRARSHRSRHTHSVALMSCRVLSVIGAIAVRQGVSQILRRHAGTPWASQTWST